MAVQVVEMPSDYARAHGGALRVLVCTVCLMRLWCAPWVVGTEFLARQYQFEKAHKSCR